jgi:hypothetical protein
MLAVLDIGTCRVLRRDFESEKNPTAEQFTTAVANEAAPA